MTRWFTRRQALASVALALLQAACSSRFSRAVEEHQGLFTASRAGGTYHTRRCAYAKNIHRKQVLYYRTGNDAFKDGFTPCSVCGSGSK